MEHAAVSLGARELLLMPRLHLLHRTTQLDHVGLELTDLNAAIAPLARDRRACLRQRLLELTRACARPLRGQPHQQEEARRGRRGGMGAEIDARRA